MWIIWHKIVVMNIWKRVISTQINQSYPICMIGVRDIILHKFWECSTTQRIWKWSEGILNYIMLASETTGKTIVHNAIVNKTTPTIHKHNIGRTVSGCKVVFWVSRFNSLML